MQARLQKLIGENLGATIAQLLRLFPWPHFPSIPMPSLESIQTSLDVHKSFIRSLGSPPPPDRPQNVENKDKVSRKSSRWRFFGGGGTQSCGDMIFWRPGFLRSIVSSHPRETWMDNTSTALLFHNFLPEIFRVSDLFEFFRKGFIPEFQGNRSYWKGHWQSSWRVPMYSREQISEFRKWSFWCLIQIRQRPDWSSNPCPPKEFFFWFFNVWVGGFWLSCFCPPFFLSSGWPRNRTGTGNRNRRNRFCRNRKRNRNRRNRFSGTETGAFLLKRYWGTEMPSPRRNRQNRKPEPLEPFVPCTNRNRTEPNRGHPVSCNFSCFGHSLCNLSKISENIMWAAAQIVYLNSCQSRFSGVYLVLKVFRDIWPSKKEKS